MGAGPSIGTAPETPIPSLAIAGRRHGRIDGWAFYAVGVSVLLAVPVLVVPVVDRGGTGRDLAAAQGVGFVPLVTAPDLGFPFEIEAFLKAV